MNPIYRSARLSLCCSAAIAASSCADDTTAKTPEDYDNVAQSLGSSVSENHGGDVAAMSDSTSIALGVMPFGFTLGGSGLITGARLGISYNLTLTCADANGVSLAVCDGRTDRADLSVAWSGDLDLPQITASVDREGSWTVTGLQSDTATFNGNGDFVFDLTLRPANLPERSYHLDYHADYNAVLIDVTSHDVIGGSVAYSIDATRTVGGDVVASFHVDANLVFDDAAVATLTLDGTHRYSVNIVTGAVVRL